MFDLSFRRIPAWWPVDGEGRPAPRDPGRGASPQINPDGHRRRLDAEVGQALRAVASTENGAVVLDARTGADRETAVSVAPLVVNEYFGLGPADAGRLTSPDTYQGNLYVYPTAS